MAKRVPKQAKKPQPSVVRRKSLAPLWITVAVVSMVIISPSSMILIFFGMLPTLAAFIIERSRNCYATFCVGGMNFSGVFPYLLELWIGNHSWRAATDTLTNPFSLLVMYGAAGFGWMLYIAIPPVVASFVMVMQQHRIAQLRVAQRKIIEEWGEDVAKISEA